MSKRQIRFYYLTEILIGAIVLSLGSLWGMVFLGAGAIHALGCEVFLGSE